MMSSLHSASPPCPISPSVSTTPSRAKPHRRSKPGYTSPATIKHSRSRLNEYILLKDNFDTLNELYGMDTTEVQYLLQNFYYSFEETPQNRNRTWVKKFLDKKRIVWINPANGFAIAALKDLETEIKLPNALQSYDANLKTFKSMWIELDFDLGLLYQNLRSHIENYENCCLDCNFPFSPVCSELYTQFEPD